jgi:hypothetical protein
MNRLALMISVGSFALIAACGSETEPEATQTTATAPQPAPTAPAKAPDDRTARMARAVGDGKPGAAVDIRYEIAAKPEVGVPTEVQVAFVPRAGVDSLDATITGMEGVTVAGNLKPHFDNVEAGRPYEHTFSLLPDRTGVYYITVSVTTALGGASIGRTFSIPFVVGTPTAQRKADPPKDASGQAIESMKGQESSG